MNTQTGSVEANEAILCGNGCGFFGTATMNLCSKCYKDHVVNMNVVKEDEAELASSPSADSDIDELEDEMSLMSLEGREKEIYIMDYIESEKKESAIPKCWFCRKKLGLVSFNCKCRRNFCKSHRYPEDHLCNYNYKLLGRLAIAKNNPRIVPDKLNKI
ncbi:zinc finger A20 and AN1 domain-containing stress-associated protein 6-like [Beta vulgaris subsp. vulgaris]|uniref:zinc finger A20 and AN1 domain-containing stress-associated protein 6-like n=1 Tax=Beta vulgaris subsp. vulgaris TaxID=3555 RepID=UPI002549659B|nr:zinc finger A20 and AN1 domain-containing stress-associated protein 6-like [Beta vulgaris subsp. vulgaris]